LNYSFYILANTTCAQGEYELARTYAQQAYIRAEAANDRWFMAYLLNSLGNVARATGDYALARQYYRASYGIRETFDDSEGMAVALNHLGQVALLEKNYLEAQQLYQQGLTIYQEINDRGGLAISLNGLGMAACAQGDYQVAQQQFHQALHIATEIQFFPVVLSILTGVAELMLQTGQPEQGKELLSLVLYHSASDHETKTRAQNLLAQYGVDASPEVEPAREFDLVVTSIHAELATRKDSDPPFSFKSSTSGLSSSPDSPALIERLTARELEILRLIADGLSNPEIAEALIVTVGTVKAHTHRIYSKLDASNRVQAVARAREVGLL
jgi:ATP/maltotriose-dependent transcriptional regulator MalT